MNETFEKSFDPPYACSLSMFLTVVNAPSWLQARDMIISNIETNEFFKENFSFLKRSFMKLKEIK